MPIRIGKVTFPYNTFCATGARGPFGDGYWFHPYFRWLGLTWEYTNFAAKTSTLLECKGNMSPEEYFPRCIKLDYWSGHVLNAAGLGGPGFQDLLNSGKWQQLTEPFVLSIIAIEATPERRRREYEQFAYLLSKALPGFKAPFVLQLDYGCPNAGLILENLYPEIITTLQIMSRVGVPLVLNFNPLVPAFLLKELEETGLVQGFWLANTIPYDYCGLGKSIFGKTVSPLLERGFDSAGGISGPKCLPHVLRLIQWARNLDVKLPIIAGNGIRTPADVHAIKDAGANAIAIGLIAMVPPWMIRMQSVIKTANRIFG